MSERANQRPAWASHQLYRQAMTRSQAEEWEEAASLLSALAAEFPGDPELEQILASLRLKASAGQERLPRRRSWLRRAWRRTLYAFGVVGILILVAICLYTVYARWLAPAWKARDQLIQVTRFHQLAKGYMAAGEYDRAINAYQEVLRLEPDDHVASAGLRRAEQLHALAIQYDRALSLTREEEWWEALWGWRLIVAQDPNFRDADYWLDFVERQDHLSRLFQEAEMRYALRDCEGAVGALEGLRSENADYKQQEVQSMLAGCLIILAEQRLWETDDPSSIRDDILAMYSDAVHALPGDQSVVEQAQVAQEYLDSHARLQPDCEEQLQELCTCYDPQAFSLPSERFLLLYQVNVSCGNQRRANRGFEGARLCYAAAMEMPLDDVSQARDEYAALVPMLTPTATATPRPPTPIATPRPATPTPTHTPTVSPYRFAQLGGTFHQSNTKYPGWGCGWLGVGGQVLDVAGSGLEGIKVRVWSGGYEFPLATSGGKWTALYGSGGWEVYLNSVPAEGTWNCQLVDDSGVGLSPVVIFSTYAGDCSRNLVLISFKQNY